MPPLYFRFRICCDATAGHFTARAHLALDTAVAWAWLLVYLASPGAAALVYVLGQHNYHSPAPPRPWLPLIFNLGLLAMAARNPRLAGRDVLRTDQYSREPLSAVRFV